MKFGANRSDINEIGRMTKAGWTSQEIEDALHIAKHIVERFMPEGDFSADAVEEIAPSEKPKKKKKRKTKGKAKKAEEPAEEAEEPTEPTGED